MTVPPALAARLERDGLNGEVERGLRFYVHVPVTGLSHDLEVLVMWIAERRTTEQNRCRSGTGSERRRAHAGVVRGRRHRGGAVLASHENTEHETGCVAGAERRHLCLLIQVGSDLGRPVPVSDAGGGVCWAADDG